MSLQIRILGMQKEPTGLEKGREIHDFQYRTRDAEAFEKGKELVEMFRLIMSIMLLMTQCKLL